MHIASAPCSFGVFYGSKINVNPLQYLDASRVIGYEGVDLGPDGFLGSPDDLAKRLAERELGLSGAYVTLGELGEEGSGQESGRLERVLVSFSRIAHTAQHLPKPVLCVAGGADTAAALPGWRKGGYGGRLPAAQVPALTRRLERIASLFADNGYDVALHPHLGTIFETLEDIEPFMDVSHLSLCVDTGHSWLAGDDPLDLYRSGSPVSLIHMKDADRQTWGAAINAPDPGRFPWRQHGFCALGEGDMNVDEFLAALRADSFEGWLVVEQDRPWAPSTEWPDLVAKQAANLAWLRNRGV